MLVYQRVSSIKVIYSHDIGGTWSLLRAKSSKSKLQAPCARNPSQGRNAPWRYAWVVVESLEPTGCDKKLQQTAVFFWWYTTMDTNGQLHIGYAYVADKQRDGAFLIGSQTQNISPSISGDP